MATNYKQGFFKPINPSKYKGDPTNIVYRSGWERNVMQWLDNKEDVKCWSSEEIVIPYISPIDGKMHRYFIDFYVEFVDRNGNSQIMLIEVKPHAQTQEPKTKKRKTKQYINEVVTYGINKAKWNAAESYCDKKGWKFQILTEKEIFNKK